MFPTGPAVVVDNRKQELQEFTITFDRADEKDAREVLADRIALMAARAREQDGPEE